MMVVDAKDVSGGRSTLGAHQESRQQVQGDTFTSRRKVDYISYRIKCNATECNAMHAMQPNPTQPQDWDVISV